MVGPEALTPDQEAPQNKHETRLCLLEETCSFLLSNSHFGLRNIKNKINAVIKKTVLCAKNR